MKNLLLTYVLVSLNLLGLAQDKTTIKLSGKITNPSSDTLIIEDGWGEQYHLMTLDKDGSFSSSFDIETGYYYLSDLNESTTIYLGEKYDLDITLDTDSFDESLTYKGKGADANNYLAKKALLDESWGRLNYYGYYCTLAEVEFLKLTDSLYNKSIQFLRRHTIQDPEFTLLEYQSLRYEKMYKLSIYPGTHGYLNKIKDYKVSVEYPFPFEGLDINDEQSIKAPLYLGTVSDFFYYTKDSIDYNEDNDHSLYITKTLATKISNDEVKKHVLFDFCRNFLTSSKEMDQCFEIYKSIETDPKRLKLIEDKYLARKKTQKGAISPPFAFENPEGKTITHKDLKGKLVYIDLWATWCGPCLREIPYFDTLQESFKDQNITFVSICQNDTKERWKQAIEVKNLKGLQLFAEGDGGQFYEDYQVTGIPRYIILDAEGKIIDSDAKRPSDKRLKAELEALLK